jgi:DNA-3-methyladenine glycosylase I
MALDSWPDGRERCPWLSPRPPDDPMVRYHDDEWGVPLHDDTALFELLTLEGAQAGLTWELVLRRREGYRRAFAGFDFERIASYDDDDTARLLADSGIVRNRAKIAATIGNARAFIEVRSEFGSFDAYVWRFVEGRPVVNHLEGLSDYPAQTAESQALSKGLQRRGFRFAGPTICYAFMQAAGLVNDHVIGCYRHSELSS